MFGFNPAWFIGIGLGALFVAVDFLMRGMWRPRFGYLCAVGGVVALMIGFSGIAWDKFSNPEAAAFYVEFCAGIEYDRGPSEISGFVLGYEEQFAGIDIVKISLLTKLVVTNLRPTRTVVESYGLQTGATKDGPWIPLCPLALKPAYSVHLFLSNGNELLQMIPNGGVLEELLVGRELAAMQTVRGWTAWRCPTDEPECPAKFFRMTIREASGSITNSLTGTCSLPHEVLGMSGFTVGTERLELSKIKHHIFRTECLSANVASFRSNNANHVMVVAVVIYAIGVFLCPVGLLILWLIGIPCGALPPAVSSHGNADES